MIATRAAGLAGIDRDRARLIERHLRMDVECDDSVGAGQLLENGDAWAFGP